MDYFEKTYHPPGTAPGTLAEPSNSDFCELAIHLIDFNSEEYLEKKLCQVDDCEPYLDDKSVTWLHIQGPVLPDTIRKLGKLFQLHPLAMEDIINTGQRPKIEEYDDLLFTVLSMLGSENESTKAHQVSLCLGRNYVVSFHNGNKDPFDTLRTRLRKKSGRVRQQKADYLFYCILDLVIDQGYPLLENLGETIEGIEEEILNLDYQQSTLGKVHAIRRELLLLRRNLWPHREVINRLLRSENELVSNNTQIYIRDCYDHVIQILDLIENYRETAANLIDVYLSSANHRLSEIMRVLTMIATIFIPLTFVVGLYGMNFNHPESPWAMPELRWYYGYPAVLGIMLIIVFTMLVYFRRKNWI